MPTSVNLSIPLSFQIPDGPQGATGPQGIQGATGPNGKQGLPGIKGDTGPVSAGPAFIATVTVGVVIPVSANALTQFPIVYNSVSKNIGSAYSPSNGTFIAPTSGFYQTSASFSPDALVAPTSNNYGGAVVGIYRNNIPIASGSFIEVKSKVFGSTTVWAVDASSVSTLVYLNVGDTLTCKVAYITNYSGFTTKANLIPNYFQACWLRP